MAVKNFIKTYFITDSAGNAITANSPLGIKSADGDGSVIEGTHLANGIWQFNIPSGRSAGWAFYVQTSAGGWTIDAYLTGTISGNNLGHHLAPAMTVED